MLRKFQSLANPQQFGYAYDSEAYDHKAPLNDHFRMFQTYGDGLCQHSGDWSVDVEHLADYLFSLAAVMLTDEELGRQLLFTIHRYPCVKDIQFAASIVYKAPKENDWNAKRKYFSREEKKISSNENKRHDKRYTELTSEYDGSPLSIFRILTPEYADGFQKYCIAEAIREWTLNEEAPCYMGLAAKFLKWFDYETNGSEYRNKALALRDAYQACKAVTDMWNQQANVKNKIENYQRSIERAREQQQAPPAESEVA